MHVAGRRRATLCCQATRANLGAYIRAGLSRRDAARVAAHLERCRPCTAIYLELVEVNSDLRGLLAPLLLGGAAAAYLADVPARSPRPRWRRSAGSSRPARARSWPVPAAAAAHRRRGRARWRGPHARRPGAGTDRSVVAAAPAQLPPAASLPAGKPGKPVKPAPSGATTTPSAQPGQVTSAQPTPVTEPVADATRPPSRRRTAPTRPTPTADADPGPDRPSRRRTRTPSTCRVSASKAGIGPAAVVMVDVAGLAPGQPGTVTVTADQLSASLNLDPRCDPARRQRRDLPGGRCATAAAAGRRPRPR